MQCRQCSVAPAAANLLENTDGGVGVMGCSDPPHQCSVAGGSLLPSIYADVRSVLMTSSLSKGPFSSPADSASASASVSPSPSAPITPPAHPASESASASASARKATEQLLRSARHSLDDSGFGPSPTVSGVGSGRFVGERARVRDHLGPAPVMKPIGVNDDEASWMVPQW